MVVALFKGDGIFFSNAAIGSSTVIDVIDTPQRCVERGDAVIDRRARSPSAATEAAATRDDA
jgi:hypothetical protein